MTDLKIRPLFSYDDFIVPGGSFKWKEYALLHDWNAYAIPTEEQKANALFLFRQLQTLIRVPLGKPLIISSGARTTEYTAYLRGKGIPAATASAHNVWAAVDLLPPSGMTNAQFWQWCHARWPGRMENLSATPGWVHLDTRQWGEKVRFNP